MKNPVFILFLLLFGITGPGYAQKARIIDFHADIKIEADGRIEVKESITVYADGNDIQRGIVRTLPMYRTDSNRKDIKMGVNIISVQRDGKAESYRTERVHTNMDVYIGDSRVYLKPGTYNYTITYDSYGHIGFFDDYDELYWNVTGNEWVFNIEKASAAITLPEGVSAIKTACYTGAQGDKGSNCKAENAGNKVTFHTSKPLSQRQGLTVAVSFPRDIIKRPPPPSEAEQFWEANKQGIIVLGGLLVMLIFYLFTWIKAGKDPRKPVVIPTFKPPHGWSATVTRYIYLKKYDNKIFSIALIEMAIKGALHILYESKKYKLKPLGENEKLSEKERKLYRSLFSSDATITISNDDYKTFAAADSVLKSSLSNKIDLKDYFLHNFKYVAFATILMVAILIAYMVFLGAGMTVLSLLILLPFILSGVTTLTVAVKERRRWEKFLLIISGLASVAASSIVMFWLFFQEDTVTAYFLSVMAILFALYIYLIKAPTELGAKTNAELKGFKMYLKAAEENRLNLLTPPEHTPELFEEMLPYAIALDVENAWGKKFNDMLKAIDYRPEWYTGSKPFRAYTFANTLSGSFANSVSSSKVNPSSSGGSSGSGGWSSGSGGGGFSGGGGGGGGGRGW